jgi:phosphomannomutase / phosphoglucomutase
VTISDTTAGINPHIFRQYDIRGIVGRDLTPEVATSLGLAFGTLLRREDEAPLKVVVGRDNRLSSDELAAALVDGLTRTGVDVIDVGTVPTPVLYFASAYLHADGAVQVTGSHNPPQYNGFKLSVRGRSIYGATIQEIRTIAARGEFAGGEGAVERWPVLPTYVEEVSRRFSIERRMKVVVDCGNGTGSVVAADLLEALGPSVEVVPIFCESDGTFPNHHPDPVVDENLVDLQRAVREHSADLGIAFDGDADRIGAVDEAGEIVRGDTLLLLFGLDLIQRRGPGQKVVFDVKCSQVLPEVLGREGGIPIMSATGHSLIKERMKTEGALLAGELSGHICFGEDYYGFDDALYAACLLISIVSRDSRPFSARLAEFPRFVSTAEIRYPTTEEQKFEVVSRAVRHFARDHEVVDVDGARVLFSDGWGLIRASNTEPVLVARYEARDAEALDRIRETMEDWLRAQEIDVG